MKVIDRTLDASKVKFDEQATRKVLAQRPQFPGTMRQLFGNESLDALGRLLCAGPLLDIDVLVATQELTPAAAVQYMKLLPEYACTFDRAHEIMRSIASKLKPILAGRVARARKGGPAEDSIQGVFNQVQRLPTIFQQTSRRRTQVEYLGGVLLDLLFVSINETVTDIADRAFFFDQYDKMSSMAFLRGAYLPCQQLFLDAEYVTRFGRDIATVDVSDDASVGQLDQKISKIQNLREYRRIFPHVCHYGQTRIVTYKNGIFGEESDNADICFFQLMLKPEEHVVLPENRIGSNGQTFAAIRARSSVLHGKVNSQGELVFASNGAISLRGALGDRWYAVLRVRVLNQIHDYLVAKDPDIPDLFADWSREVVRESIAQTLDDTSIVDATTAEDIVEDALDMHTANDVVLDTNVLDSGSYNDGPARRQPKSPRIGHSLKAEVVLRTLKRILGSPLRTSSSHVIFKALNSNVTYPISLHGGRDVTPPLLAKCLEMWGVSIPQFLDAM